MKTIKITTGLLALALLSTACEVEGINETVPNLTDQGAGAYDKVFDVSTDNSGQVRITPLGTGIARSIIDFGDATGAAGTAVVNAGESIVHTYAEGDYTVSITSIDLSGKETTSTYPLSVKFVAPTDLKIGLNSGGLTLNVTPEAQMATGGYRVFFGEDPGDLGLLIEEGETATHTYAQAGEYTIRVIAYSGGAATATTSVETVINNPLGLPIDFETPYTNYGVAGVFGGMGMGFVENPNSSGLNTSLTVLQLTKGVGAESWAGVYIPLGSPGGIPINIDQGSVFKVLVYASQAGKSLRLQLEDGSDYKPGVEVPISSVNQWQELTFDFSTLNVPAGYIFNQIVLQYNASAAGEGEVIFVDSISQLTN